MTTSRRATFALLLGMLGLALACLTVGGPPAVRAAVGPPVRRAQILWDTWGVPHIYANDPESLAYAFGYAQLHSHGNSILRAYALARGQAAEYWGPNFRASDRVIRTLGIPQAGQEAYTAQSPAFRRYLDAFADGLNAYALDHPDELADDVRVVLPVSASDVLAHIHRFFAAFLAVGGDRTPVLGLDGFPTSAAAGSNAWAIGPTHSTSGNSLLLINPHLPWDPPLQHLYEAQLVAPDAGINAYGAAVIGAPALATGFNDFLGWAHTLNTLDGFDTFALVPSADGGGYVLDGETRAFAVEQQTMRIKQPDGSQAEETLLVRRTEHGPVLNTPDGRLLAVRMVGLTQHGALQEWWDMARAHDFNAFQTALATLQLPTFSVIYADRDGHILSQYNGQVPRRAAGDFRQWLSTAPGDTSTAIWTETLAYSELPRVVDPATGWVQNSNSPPWTTTLPSPLDPNAYPPYLAPRQMLMREQSGVRLLGQSGQVSLDQLEASHYSNHVELADRVLPDLIAAATGSPSPIARQAADVLAGWDRSVDASSRGAVLFDRWAQHLFSAGIDTPGVFARGWDERTPASTPTGLADPARAVQALELAAQEVYLTFKAVDVPFGDVFRVRRGGVDLAGNGLGGEPVGVFHVLDYAPDADGRYHAVAGDTFVAVVEFTPAGPRARALLTYGNATQPGSSHLADQLPLLATKTLRPVWLTRAEVEAHLEDVTQLG